MTTRTRAGTGSQVGRVVVLAGVQFLVVLDSLAVALALPQIGRDLDLAASGLAWLVNGYSLALVAGLLLAGRVSDVHGRRPTLLAGLVHGLLSEQAPEHSLRTATAIAAMAVTQIGFGISDAAHLARLESGVSVRPLTEQ